MSFSKDAKESLACIFSVAGPSLSEDERTLFKNANPFGFILFARNCETPNQLKRLTEELKDTVGRECPILIDQEGGRVQRLKPPHWQQHKPMKFYGDLYTENPPEAEVKLRNDTDRLLKELLNAGINVNCAPCIDVLTPTTHDIIGDRAFSDDPAIASRLGAVVCEQFLKNGITPIIKHIPGHGRATADSHLELPKVTTSLEELKKTDFAPFAQKYRPSVWAMTAHIIFTAIDPDLPVSISPKAFKMLREDLKFGGILLSDDLDMKALDPFGTIAERCIKTLQAGCDLALYCHADLKIMEEITEICPKLTPEALKRLQKGDEMWDKVA